MSYIPNSKNNNFEAQPVQPHSDVHFSGTYSKLTYKDFLPEDTTSLTKTKKKTGFSFRNWFRSPTYKDFMPGYPDRRQSGFNNWFKSTTYKDFMPNYPAKKQSSIGAWIGGILGGTFGLGLLTFFTRAHFFNGGLFKGGVKSTWTDLKKLIGIKPKPLKNKKKEPASSTDPASSIEELDAKKLTKEEHHTFLEQHIEQLKALPVGSVVSIEQLFGNEFKNLWILQHSGNTCYRLAMIDNIVQHQCGSDVLKSIQFKTTQNGLEVAFPPTTRSTIHNRGSVEVTYDMLRHERTATAAYPGPALLEQAVGLHFNTAEERADIGESGDLIDIMVADHLLPDAEPFNWTPSTHSPEQYKANLLKIIQDAKADEILPFMTTLRGGHIRSPRLLESSETHIHLFNPSAASRIEVVPIDDFVKNFQLIGFGRKVPAVDQSILDAIRSSPSNRLDFEIQYANDSGNLARLARLLTNHPALAQRCKSEAQAQVSLLNDLFTNASITSPFV